jgi:hypothetical protein
VAEGVRPKDDGAALNGFGGVGLGPRHRERAAEDKLALSLLIELEAAAPNLLPLTTNSP